MPLPQVQTSPQEDLSVVMGRFHEWDAIQNATAPGRVHEGLRELSYEEAIEASRSRRASKPPMPPVVARQLISEAGIPTVVPGEPGLDLLPTGVVLAGKSPAKARGLARPRKQAAVAAMVAVPIRKGAKKPAASRKHAPTAGKFANEKSSVDTADSVSKRVASVKARKSTNAQVSANEPGTFREALAASVFAASIKKSQGSAGVRSRRKTVNVVASETVKARGQSGVPGRSRSIIESAKIPVKKGSSCLLGSARPVAAREGAVSRTISLKLRLSEYEQAGLQAAAREAGVSLGIYMRQSALQFTSEREKQPVLRERNPARRAGELPEAVATLFESYQQSLPDEKAPSLLSRMRIFWFGKRVAAIA